MDATTWGTLVLVLDYLVKFLAIGLIPENRHPSSSLAWLLVVLLVPIIGLPLFLLVGSPYVRGRRHRIRAKANEVMSDRFADDPLVPTGVEVDDDLWSLLTLNRNLTALPAVLSDNLGVVADYSGSIERMAEAVDEATSTVHVEIYAVARDHTTEVFFLALERAAAAQGSERVYLGAQVTAVPFYERLGYRVFGEPFVEAGIPHRLMEKTVAP